MPRDRRQPTPTEFAKADDYKVGERIASNFTRRRGTVVTWPVGSEPVVGAVWVDWDDGTKGIGWRHQVHRI